MYDISDLVSKNEKYRKVEERDGGGANLLGGYRSVI